MIKKNNVLSILILITSIFIFSTNAFASGTMIVLPSGSMIGAGVGNQAGTGGGPTAPLKLEQCSINSGSYNIPINPRITMRFTKNVGDKVVRNNNATAIKLVKKPSNEEVSSYKIGFSDEFMDRQFIQILADNLEEEKTYAIQISTKIKARNGKDTLDKAYEIVFTTGTKQDSKQQLNKQQSNQNTNNNSAQKSNSNNSSGMTAARKGQLIDCPKASYKGDGSKENPYCILVKDGTYTAPSKFWKDMVKGGGFNVVFEGRESNAQTGKLLYSYTFNKDKSISSNWRSDWKYAFRLATYCDFLVNNNSLKVVFPWKGNFSFYWRDWEYKLNVTALTKKLPEAYQIKPGDKIKMSHYGNYDEKQTSRGTNYEVDFSKTSQSANWSKTVTVDENGYAIFSDKNYIKYGGNYSIEKVLVEENSKLQKNNLVNKGLSNSTDNHISYEVDKVFVLDIYKTFYNILTNNEFSDINEAIKIIKFNRDMLYVVCNIIV